MTGINFCDGRIGTRLVCSKVAMDGYEASNLLISTAAGGRSKGFLAETFVRPPVDVTLHFPCNVDIESVVICGRVGMQKTCGVEMLLNTNRIHYNSVSDVKLALVEIADSDLEYESAGFACDMNSYMFAFRNPRFRIRRPFDEIETQCNQSEADHVVRNLRFRPPTELHHVSHLTIRLNRTKQSGPPALGWIKVWGQPSRNCPEKLQLELFKIISKASESQSYISCSSKMPNTLNGEKFVSQNTKAGTRGRTRNRDVICDTESDIPTEFLDPLTQHIMALPVLLPSGHTIDQSSLERHNNTQASWGRPAADPFTGVPFTESSKPVPNTSLKLRLDAFLLRHGHMKQVAEAGRTLGRGSRGHAQASRLCVTSNSTAHSLSRPVTGNSQRNLDCMQPSLRNRDTLSLLSNGRAGMPQNGHNSGEGHSGQSVSNTTVDMETILHPRKKRKRDSHDQSLGKSARVTSTQIVKTVPYVDLIGDEPQETFLSIPDTVVDLTEDNTYDVSSNDVSVNQKLLHNDIKTSSSVDDMLDDVLGGLPSYVGGAKSQITNHLPTHGGQIVKHLSHPQTSLQGHPGSNKLSISSLHSSSQPEMTAEGRSRSRKLNRSSHQPLDTSTGTSVYSSNGLTDELRCAICNLSGTQETSMYQAPCQHTICRNCLTRTNSAELLCKLCNSLFKTKDVIKVHKWFCFPDLFGCNDVSCVWCYCREMSFTLWFSYIYLRIYWLYFLYVALPNTEIILGMGSANERHCYNVTSSLISWAHTQNDACNI